MTKAEKVLLKQFTKRLTSSELFTDIEEALKECELESERIRRDTEVDWRKLDEPMTI